jgi:hypothetical protein
LTNREFAHVFEQLVFIGKSYVLTLAKNGYFGLFLQIHLVTLL